MSHTVSNTAAPLASRPELIVAGSLDWLPIFLPEHQLALPTGGLVVFCLHFLECAFKEPGIAVKDASLERAPQTCNRDTQAVCSQSAGCLVDSWGPRNFRTTSTRSTNSESSLGTQAAVPRMRLPANRMTTSRLVPRSSGELGRSYALVEKKSDFSSVCRNIPLSRKLALTKRSLLQKGNVNAPFNFRGNSIQGSRAWPLELLLSCDAVLCVQDKTWFPGAKVLPHAEENGFSQKILGIEEHHGYQPELGRWLGMLEKENIKK